MEGELIECLNAGDGSWWTGRLRRDRRMVGSFPSNFVEVLPDDFRPTSRATSPMVDSNGNTPSPKGPISKTKTFRKPFEAYAKAPHYTTAKQPETYKDGVKPRPREGSDSSFRNSSLYRNSQNGSTRSRESRTGSFRDAQYDSFREVHVRSRQNSHRTNTENSIRESRSGYAQNSFNSSRKNAYFGEEVRAPSPNPQPQRTRRGTAPALVVNRLQSPQPPQQLPLTHFEARPYAHSYSHSQPPLLSHTQLQHHGIGHHSESPNPPVAAVSPAMSQWAHESSHDPVSYRNCSPNPIVMGGSYSPNPMMMNRHYSPNTMMDRPHSPNPIMNRAPSPIPMASRSPSPFTRQSPSPQPHLGPGSREPSPTPSFSFRPYRPGAERNDSPPPPMPPPHRHIQQCGSAGSYNQLARQTSHNSYDPDSYGAPGLDRHGSQVSFDSRMYNDQAGRHNSNISQDPPKQNGYRTPRTTSPCPPSPAGEGFTPSPLREAMDDVYKELDALGMSGQESEKASREALNPWSPESFDMVHQRSKRKNQPRPLTSTGFVNIDEGYETHSGSGVSSRDALYHGAQKGESGLPEVGGYVEKMESQLRKMYSHNSRVAQQDEAPTPPPKGAQNPFDRPKSSMSGSIKSSDAKLRNRKPVYEALGRTFTTKTNSTTTSAGNRSTTTQSTNKTLMSTSSAGAVSATSAGSMARRQQRPRSAFGMRGGDEERPESPFSGVTYHSSHASQNSQIRPQSQIGKAEKAQLDPMMDVGGLVQPQKKKRGLFGKIRDMAKTGVASGRNTIVAASPAKASPMANTSMNKSFSGLPGASPFRNSVHGLGQTTGSTGRGGGTVDWVEVRRDVNRSNTLSRNERTERRERCQMLDYPAINPVDELFSNIEGNEGIDGQVVCEPINYQSINLNQVDKNSRFIGGLPPTITAISLTTQYVCRPFRSDVQKLRAIFTWVAEKLTWEEDFEGEIDTRLVLKNKRACAEEYAVLVAEMCDAAGLPCEVVRGYLKTPGEVPESGIFPRSNHWWNCVVVDNEWRIMDCCLASPSNPQRSFYSAVSSSSADPWWFLTRPTEACWTHIPELAEQQHICPPVAHEILLNLPCACPPYFKNSLDMVDYNTSLTRIEDLEMVHVQFSVPSDVEVAAEVEVRAFSRDMDGDFFESGETIKKRALAQAEWFNGMKRYTVKALLPGDEGTGTLKVYAGKRGLMHSIKDIPHPLAFALPIIHTGENPPYDFVTRHPTPHAQRHDIYVVQPQCRNLALNNTFVFAVRQHPAEGSSLPGSCPENTSPVPFARPSSALSMTASSVSGTSSSTSGYPKKPAKLAIQTPGGKILRLMRKEEKRSGIGVGGRPTQEESASDGGTWETIIKCSERGTWRGLVLADRTARWCVFAEWACV